MHSCSTEQSFSVVEDEVSLDHLFRNWPLIYQQNTFEEIRVDSEGHYEDIS
jgi:hypothetical protein